jgi:hypothetical protein
VTVSPTALLKPRPLAAAGAVVLALAWLRPGAPPPPRRRLLAVAVPVGLLGAAAAYSSFILAERLVGAYRTEFLAAPWIGVALAAAIALASDAAPSRAQFPASRC